MQLMEDDAPVSSKVIAMEHKLGEMATPAGETSFVRAFGPQGEVFYAVQPFRYRAGVLDYYALRLRKLGHLRYVGNRRKPQYVTVAFRNSEYDLIRDSVYALVHTERGTITLGPKGRCELSDTDDRGMGIGSFALSMLVRWLKQNYPDLKVNKGALAQNLPDNETRRCRDRLLENAGLTVVYTDNKGKGYFYANSVDELREYNNQDKVEAMSLNDFFRTYAVMQEWHNDLQNDQRELFSKHQVMNEFTIPNLQRRARVNLWVGFMMGSLGIFVGLLIGLGAFH